MPISIADVFNRTTALPRYSDEVVADIAARDAILLTLRYEFMTVSVTDEGKTYQLVGGVTNDDWVEFGSGGGVWTTEQGIEAYAGGGQTDATQLTANISSVDVVATDGDSVKLPVALGGEYFLVRNEGASILDIFPASGEEFWGLAADQAIQVEAGGYVEIVSIGVGVWFVKGAEGTTVTKDEVGEVFSSVRDADKPHIGTFYCGGASYNAEDYPELAYHLWNTTQGKWKFGGTGTYPTGTFNVPDMRGLFQRGMAGDATTDVDKTGRMASGTNGVTGNTVGSYQPDENKPHQHVIRIPYRPMVSGTFSTAEGGAATNNLWSDQSGTPPHYGLTAADGTPGATDAHPKNLYFNFFIRYRNFKVTVGGGSGGAGSGSGIIQVATIGERDTIDSDDRTEGMLVYVIENQVTYQLKGGTGNDNWITFVQTSNYIKNPNADVDLLGWVSYDDGAVAIPVDGTGGTPSTSVVRDATNPLSGKASLVWTKPALADRQGEGFSYDFTIKREDQGRLLDIGFSMELLSGSYTGSLNPAVASDFTCWIYDITNARLIAPTIINIEPMTTGHIYKRRVSFQTAINSTSYRLIIHRATDILNAVSMKFGSFAVGPQESFTGVSQSPSQSYTPVITQGKGTLAATLQGKWHQDGEFAVVTFQLSTVTSGTGAAADLLVSLPPGLTAESGQLLDIGQGTFYTTSLGFKNTAVRLASNTTVQFTKEGASAWIQGSDFANSPFISVTYRVKIAGWSVGSSMSTGNTVEVQARASNASSTTIPNNTVTQIALNNATVDTTGSWVGNTFVPKVSGWYFCGLFTVFSGNLASSVVAQSYVRVAGVVRETLDRKTQSVTNQDLFLIGAKPVYALAGQAIDFAAYHNAGSNKSIGGNADYNNCFVFLIQPAVQAISSVPIAGRVWNNSGTTMTIPTSATKITTLVVDHDPHGMWDDVDKTFVLKESGEYDVDMGLRLTSMSGNVSLTIGYVHNGTHIQVGGATGGQSGYALFANCSTKIQGKAGDRVGLSGYSSTAQAGGDYSPTNFSIAKVG